MVFQHPYAEVLKDTKTQFSEDLLSPIYLQHFFL